MLKAVYMHAQHVVYAKTLLRTLQAGIENTNPLISHLFRLLRNYLGSLCGFPLYRIKFIQTVAVGN